MTLLSLTNNVSSDVAFIPIYTMNNRGPRTDTWGTPCFNVPKSEKKFCAV